MSTDTLSAFLAVAYGLPLKLQVQIEAELGAAMAEEAKAVKQRWKEAERV